MDSSKFCVHGGWVVGWYGVAGARCSGSGIGASLLRFLLPHHPYLAGKALRAKVSPKRFEHLQDDDWVPEELPKVFSMIGPATLPTLERFLADDDVEESCRLFVPQCLVRIGQGHPGSRDACVQALVRQLETFETNGPALNGFLIASLIDLGAAPAIRLIILAARST